MTVDITSILEDWPYESGKISVRRILGSDGKPKIQLRLDLGVLQMEAEGRPDGQRPYGFESVLDYYAKELADYRVRHGDDGFELNEDACEELRAESVMYYHRYLSEFALEDYAAVDRDTQRNLRVLDLCALYGSNEMDRGVMEQYRPYILMMNTRARALDALERNNYGAARRAVQEGLQAIESAMDETDQAKLAEESSEAAILKALLEEIERREPRDPVREVEDSLAQAVEDERYEEAAKLRDRLQAMRERLKHRA